MKISSKLQKQAEEFAKLVGLQQIIDNTTNDSMQEDLKFVKKSESIHKSVTILYSGILSILINSVIDSNRLNTTHHLFPDGIISLHKAKRFIATFIYCNRKIYNQYPVAKSYLPEIIKRDWKTFHKWITS